MLMVIRLHYVLWLLPITELSPTLQRLVGISGSGVELFFVLSGFLIGGILLDHRRAPRFFTTFYIRRFFRIVPLYALVCGTVFLLLLVVSNPTLIQVLETPIPPYAYALFLQNIWVPVVGDFGGTSLGPAWSLGVEE